MHEDRIYQEETIEIHIVDMFWSILRYWRSILLAVVILGIILAGYGGIKEYRHLTDEDFVKEQQESYESALETYELKKKQLEKKLENLQEDLARQEFYEQNAIMLLFDEYNVYIQTASFYINTGYEIAPELYYQNPNYTGVITNSYKAAIDRIDLDEIIATAESPDLTTRNPVSGSKKMLYTSADSGNGVLSITIFGDTEERAKQIYSAVKKVIAEQEILLNQVIGEHTIGILSEKSYTDIDMDFGNLQDSFDSKSESITTGIEDTQKSLEDLEEPVNETPTIASVIKSGFRYGGIGIIVGLVLLVGFCAMKLIVEDKVDSVEGFRRRYPIPVLGVYFDHNRTQRKIDIVIAKKLGMPVTKPIDDQIRFMASNIQLHLKKNKKIVLLGNCEKEKLNTLYEKLKACISEIEISVGGNINDNPQAVLTLTEEVAVVCVETWTKTPHREIRHELETVSISGNKNIGFILVS